MLAYDSHAHLQVQPYAWSWALAAFLDGEDKGHLDLPKARKGGFAGGLFAIFVPSPKRKDGTRSEATPQEAGSVIGNDPSPPAVEM